MSEYQYYEFQTVNRRLSEVEMRELRAYSTRARITATSFVNDYSWGNFKGNSELWMEKYFDGHLYFANWGTHILKFALPKSALPLETIGSYRFGDAFSAREKSGRIVLSFHSEDEGGSGEPDGGEGLLSSLLPLRADLGRGDFRCLYLGWLLSVQAGELPEGEVEPPVPPNLGKLSGAVSDFAKFLRIDPSLIAAAAQASPQVKQTTAKHKDFIAWIASLPALEKDRLLVRLMEDNDADVGGELHSRFRKQQAVAAPTNESTRRTVGQLLEVAETFSRKGERGRR